MATARWRAIVIRSLQHQIVLDQKVAPERLGPERAALGNDLDFYI